MTNDGDCSVDCSTSRTAVLDMDGRLDSRVSRHFQENVDIETRIRRGRSARCSPKDILGTFSTVNFELNYCIAQGAELMAKKSSMKLLTLRHKAKVQESLAI